MPELTVDFSVYCECGEGRFKRIGFAMLGLVNKLARWVYNRTHRPCPVCGNKNLNLKTLYPGCPPFVKCRSCGFEGPLRGRDAGDEQAAWVLWDTAPSLARAGQKALKRGG